MGSLIYKDASYISHLITFMWKILVCKVTSNYSNQIIEVELKYIISLLIVVKSKYQVS